MLSLARVGGRRLSRGLVAAVLTIVLAGCFTRGGPDTSPARVHDEIRVVNYALTVRGALRLQLERPDVQVRELSVNDDRFPETRVLSMGSDWIPWSDKQVALLFSFMGYRGNGSYAIQPRSEATPAGQGKPDVSEVVMKYRQGADEKTERSFFIRRAPCVVEIESDVAAGRLHCERLGDERGREISIILRWWS